MRGSTASSIQWREPLLAVIALAVGIAIAWVDSRPTWDDTGITAVSLLGAAAIITALSGRRPLVWALLVGAWTPLLEIPASGNPAAGARLRGRRVADRLRARAPHSSTRGTSTRCSAVNQT
jgi:hypothetical protein